MLQTLAGLKELEIGPEGAMFKGMKASSAEVVGPFVVGSCDM